MTDDIHGYFGLTYSNYLVLHRTLMQSMPAEWQQRMVGLLRELDDAFRHIDRPDCYEVTAAVECEYGDLTDEDMQRLGINTGDHEDDDEIPEYYYDRHGQEHHASDRLLLPAPGGDPIPHYNRGRTYIEPRFPDRPPMPNSERAKPRGSRTPAP